MEIIFASQNKNKLLEISVLMPAPIRIIGTDSLSITGELPETSDTLEGNALQKARFVAALSGRPCFADDTGLEIIALGGKPGVYSARYAGEEKNADANMEKVLSELKGVADRRAHFRTVIAFVNGNEEKLFEGIVEGKILEGKKGDHGFGYDPIFQPDGFSKSFAEMQLDEKNTVSHRARALQKLVAFLAKEKIGFNN